MIPLQQAHKILAAVGLVRADNEAQQLAQRILFDPLVASRANEFILSGAGAAPEALAALHPLEKSALFARLRIAGGAATAAPRGTATWVVRKSQYSNKPEIYAACSACNQSMQFAPGNGPVPSDFMFSHCGKNEECPQSLLYGEYVRALGGPSDTDLAYDYAQLKDTNAAILKEQAAQDRRITRQYVGEKNVQSVPPTIKFLD